MTTFLITYDLNRPGQNYTNLIEAIKRLGYTWAHPELSVWMVRSNSNACAIRDMLILHVDRNDKLLVCEIGREAAWFNLDQDVSNWLQNNLAA